MMLGNRKNFKASPAEVEQALEVLRRRLPGKHVLRGAVDQVRGKTRLDMDVHIDLDCEPQSREGELLWQLNGLGVWRSRSDELYLLFALPSGASDSWQVAALPCALALRDAERVALHLAEMRDHGWQFFSRYYSKPLALEGREVVAIASPYASHGRRRVVAELSLNRPISQREMRKILSIPTLPPRRGIHRDSVVASVIKKLRAKGDPQHEFDCQAAADLEFKCLLRRACEQIELSAEEAWKRAEEAHRLMTVYDLDLDEALQLAGQRAAQLSR